MIEVAPTEVEEMDSARSWLQKFQPRDKTKGAARKKEEDNNGGTEDSNAPVDEAALSSATKQKVAAAKQYIENHYKEQMKNLQERKERYDSLVICADDNYFLIDENIKYGLSINMIYDMTWWRCLIYVADST